MKSFIEYFAEQQQFDLNTQIRNLLAQQNGSNNDQIQQQIQALINNYNQTRVQQQPQAQPKTIGDMGFGMNTTRRPSGFGTQQPQAQPQAQQPQKYQLSPEEQAKSDQLVAAMKAKYPNGLMPQPPQQPQAQQPQAQQPQAQPKTIGDMGFGMNTTRRPSGFGTQQPQKYQLSPEEQAKSDQLVAALRKLQQQNAAR